MKTTHETDDSKRGQYTDENKTALITGYRVPDEHPLVSNSQEHPGDHIPGFSQAGSPYFIGLGQRTTVKTGVMEIEGNLHRVDVLAQKAGPIGRIVAKLSNLHPNKITIKQDKEPLSADQAALVEHSGELSDRYGQLK